MFEEILNIHQEVMSQIPTGFKRYLYHHINWDARGIAIVGDRGVGKTTMICQNLLERYPSPGKALYLSADHIYVISYGLLEIASYFFSHGGEALFIDEVHKYPEWSFEIKNLLDTYKDKQIVFSASSSLDLNRSKGDLSRRVVYHRLPGLSFREFLQLSKNIDFSSITLNDILHNHVEIASKMNSFPVLQYFDEYLKYGYYPFFLEGTRDYLSKVTNVIEKVLFEDVAVVYNLKQTTLPVLKKILWLVATSNGLIPNIDKISKNIGISREMVYNCIEYLCSAGLLNDLYPAGKGNNLIRKPGKIFLGNVNLLHAINGSLKLEADVGGVRETFFANQLTSMHKIALHHKRDFLIDEKWIMEIGGSGKTKRQIKGEKDGFLILDNMKMGFGNKIPLYLFGFLY